MRPKPVFPEARFYRQKRPRVVYAIGDVLIHPAFIDANYDYDLGAPVLMQYPGFFSDRDGGD